MTFYSIIINIQKKGKMAGTFTIFEIKNPMNSEADAILYAGVKYAGDVTLKSSDREVSGCCAVTRAVCRLYQMLRYMPVFSHRGLSPTSTDTPTLRAGSGKSSVIKL
jgi:hypothetical protein